MNKIQSFTDLHSWQESHKLVLAIYKTAKELPKEEQFALGNQLRRAAISITSNIAEGFSRQSYKEKSQFYRISLASLTEVQNQILIARDVEYISHEKFKELAELSVISGKLLNGLIKKTNLIIQDS